jgi:hypothetical protein
VFARAKGGTCTDLESRNRSILGGYDSMIACDDESLANAELERGRGTESEFSDSTGKLFLGQPKEEHFR